MKLVKERILQEYFHADEQQLEEFLGVYRSFSKINSEHPLSEILTNLDLEEIEFSIADLEKEQEFLTFIENVVS